MAQPVESPNRARRLYPAMGIEDIQISRDGRWLTGRRSDESIEGQLGVFAADGSSWRPLPGVKHPNHPAWSPDGHYVVATGKEGEVNSLLVTPLDGGPSTPLTGEKCNEGRARWSADGLAVYFQSDRDGVAGIYRLPWPVRGQPELIWRQGVEAMESPDGKQLYLLTHEQHSNLLAGSPRGGDFRPVTGFPKVEPGRWGCIRDGIWYLYAGFQNEGRVGFLPYGAQFSRELASPAVNGTASAVIAGMALDWTGAHLYWSGGQTEASVYLGTGFA